MKLATCIAIALSAGVVGAVAEAVFRPAPPPPAVDPQLDTRLLAVEASLAELTRALRALPPELGSPTPTRSSPIDMQAAIDRAVTEQLAARLATPAAVSATGADEPGGFELAAAIGQLLDPLAAPGRREELWAKIAAAGQLDEAIAMLKQRLAQDPANPALATELGMAYIQKLQRADGMVEQGALALAADQMFDAALKADPQHWEARFTKAVSLSFWPPITGKQSEAVQQFQALIAQQEQSGATQPHYAQSYLLLGNLYLQQGKADLAQDVWSKGLAQFPDNPGLLQQLDSLH